MIYYFHKTDSFESEQVHELYINFGYEGVGLYYVILEKLFMQEKRIKTSVLKSQLKVGKRLEKCWKFMEEIGLISSEDGQTFTKEHEYFSDLMEEKREKKRISMAQSRDIQRSKKNVEYHSQACGHHKGVIEYKGVIDNGREEGIEELPDETTTEYLKKIEIELLNPHYIDSVSKVANFNSDEFRTYVSTWLLRKKANGGYIKYSINQLKQFVEDDYINGKSLAKSNSKVKRGLTGAVPQTSNGFGNW